jgi:GNAT superfamily N-acetyltransferase
VQEVRHAAEADLAEMLVVDAMAAAGDAERVAYLTRAVEHDDCFVAIDDGTVRGFVVVKRQHFFDRDFVDLLFVADGHRRRGLGGELMKAAVATATSTDVFTSTNESNAPMQALLKAEGWTFSGTLVGLDEGDPELVYYFRR